MKEIWKDIVGYEGLYQISNFGNVRSLNYRKTKGVIHLIKTKINNSGYIVVKLNKGGNQKTYTVHRLVALHFSNFIPEPNKTINNYVVNHKDENKLNNDIHNLEFTTIIANNMYGTRTDRASKSSYKSVICIENRKMYPSVLDAHEQTGIDASSIIRCCKGKQITTGGYHWKYLD